MAPSLTARVAQAFDVDGPLATTLPGFEPRPGQRRLAQEIARTFEDGGVLVAEAGTGTGKTLAYLIPAVLSGRRVLVSTGTRTLQDQIFYKDVPLLSQALSRPVKAAYMKGRTNYLCLHRFAGLRDAEAGLLFEDRRRLAQIAEWATATTTGDRGEIEDLPDHLPLWAELSATAEQCLGRDCPQFDNCFITRMREEAAAAEVVIVNHHLLCADASVRLGNFGEVIPECALAVIDEAHQLEDVVTQYFGVSLSVHRVDEFARDVAQSVGQIPADQGAFAVHVSSAASDVQARARRFFDQARLEVTQQGQGDRVRLSEDAALRLLEPSLSLTEALETLASRIEGRPDAPADLAAVAVRARGMRDDLAVLLSADDARYVHFVEARGRGISLRAAPIDASSLIRDHVVGERHATVMTSATLTVEGTFTYAVGRLGVSDARTLRLPSEFDFASQAMLYLPRDMPDPRSPSFNDDAAVAIEGLLDASQGRAFVLFTSYSAMRAVHERLTGRVPWPLLLQGSAPRTALLRDFRATPNAVLLATSSFWQGVDVAGDALSCVIVDRLPFASPGDPLVAARIAAVTARGGHAFHDYQVPLATLTLLQGLGRLIRTKSDRGVLAVLDPRLTRMPYGRRFLASFPPAPMTTDLDSIVRFFNDDRLERVPS